MRKGRRKTEVARQAIRNRLKAVVVLSVTLAALLGVAAPAHAASTYVVTSGANALGTCRPSTAVFPWRPGCTLPSAILAANQSPGLDYIQFRIGSGGPATIQVPLWDTGAPGEVPSRELPLVTEAVVLDATTQPGYSGSPLIHIHGATPGPTSEGFDGGGAQPEAGIRLYTNGAVVKGVAVSEFKSAIDIRGNDNRVEASYLGTNRGGTQADPKTMYGVNVRGDRNIVGGSGTARNVISGMNSDGVLVRGGSANRIEGNYIGTNPSALTAIPNGSGVALISGSDHVVRGNVIAASEGSGVSIRGERDANLKPLSPAIGVRIEGNYIGTNVFGHDRLGNGIGVSISTFTEPLAVGATIGGTTIAARNIIAGNDSHGIHLGANANGNRVVGNYVGLQRDGSCCNVNADDGIHVESSDNQIGGTGSASRNVISANIDHGIWIAGQAASGNRIQGNYIGLDATGESLRGSTNRRHGVRIDGSSNLIGGVQPGERNVISSNGELGVFIVGPSNRVEGNYIGTNAAGNAGSRNGMSGILIQDASGNVVGGSTAAARNVISGNNEAGVGLLGEATTGNLIRGNYIGTDAAGSVAIPNAWSGIVVSAPRNIVTRNVLSGNTDSGIQIIGASASGNTVQGNVVGATADATRALPNREGIFIQAPKTVVGGGPGLGNVISGNLEDGVLIDGPDAFENRLIGNYVGTNGAGRASVPNRTGIRVIDARSTMIGDGGNANIVSGNTEHGIRLLGPQTVTTTISGNSVGVQADGVSALPNGGDGLLIEGGRSSAVTSNVIAFNRTAGIRVLSGTENALRRNSIHSNGGLGIDLGTAGVASNDDGDLDGGANLHQNYPRIVRATLTTDGKTGVSGTLRSTPNTVFEIQIFSNASCDPSQFGEGRTYLGSVTVTTDFIGRTNFSLNVSDVNAGEVLTSTATSASGNTSEFSGCLRVA